MATTVTYNGVTIHNVVTRRWDQEIVYDDSDTDTIGARFSLDFEGIIHAQVPTGGGLTSTPAHTTGAGIGNNPISATEAYKSARARLSEPREDLVVRFGGEVALLVTSSERSEVDSMDVNHGPKPPQGRHYPGD